MQAPATIRPLRAGEGPRLRELRLRAIQDAPHAFFHPADVEEALPPAHWEDWATGDKPGRDRVMFVAVADGEWLGMAGCVLRADSSGTLDATGMWVAPGARGQNLGARLVDEIVAWGRERGAVRMEFAVTETNEIAIALYRRLGFTPTGRRRAGGFLGVGLVVAGVAPPNVTTAALLGAVPMALAAAAAARYGIETRQRRLEEISLVPVPETEDTIAA
jgi:ribosomal protein S18 acetylase RimI-like enzyme